MKSAGGGASAACVVPLVTRNPCPPLHNSIDLLLERKLLHCLHSSAQALTQHTQAAVVLSSRHLPVQKSIPSLLHKSIHQLHSIALLIRHRHGPRLATLTQQTYGYLKSDSTNLSAAMSSNPQISSPGSSTYDSNTLHVGDGTWDASRDDFLLPNLIGLNFETMQYNGKLPRLTNTFHRLCADATFIQEWGIASETFQNITILFAPME
jgi:hypothetical protein